MRNKSDSSWSDSDFGESFLNLGIGNNLVLSPFMFKTGLHSLVLRLVR